jgi:hypothetical protein
MTAGPHGDVTPGRFADHQGTTSMLRPTTGLAALALLALVAACAPSTYGGAATIHGDGAATSQARATDPFRRIRVGEGLRLDARTGTARSVSVTAQPNLLPLIDTTVHDGELVVSLASRGIESGEPVTITVVAPDLDMVRLDTGAIGTLDVTAQMLELDVTGGATVAANGSVGSLDLHADVGGRAELSAVRVGDATVSIGGGGSATIAPDDSITGVVGNGGNLVLATRPAQVRVEVRQGGTMFED